MKTKETSRELAIKWWNDLPDYSRMHNPLKTSKHGLTYIYFPGRTWKSLTGREIEEIWRKECNQIENDVFESKNPLGKTFDEIEQSRKLNQKQYSQEEVDRMLDKQAAITANEVLKKNQKQFKEFNPILFKSYIDKFSEEDKRKAFELIFDSIADSNKAKFILQSEIIDWYKKNIY